MKPFAELTAHVAFRIAHIIDNAHRLTASQSSHFGGRHVIEKLTQPFSTIYCCLLLSACAAKSNVSRFRAFSRLQPTLASVRLPFLLSTQSNEANRIAWPIRALYGDGSVANDCVGISYILRWARRQICMPMHNHCS